VFQICDTGGTSFGSSVRLTNGFGATIGKGEAVLAVTFGSDSSAWA
jgi:hypothetical protein